MTCDIIRKRNYRQSPDGYQHFYCITHDMHFEAHPKYTDEFPPTGCPDTWRKKDSLVGKKITIKKYYTDWVAVFICFTMFSCMTLGAFIFLFGFALDKIPVSFLQIGSLGIGALITSMYYYDHPETIRKFKWQEFEVMGEEV